MTALHIMTYATVAVFIVAVVARFIRIASQPLHLRWELYPVPHEKGRAHYGGSRLEEVDWWTKPAQKDHLGELSVMAPEIVFLKGVWDHNRKLWSGSFPFHFALYMLGTNMLLLAIAGIMGLSGNMVSQSAMGWALILYYLIYYITLAGTLIGVIGAVRIFFMRVVDQGLRNFSTPSHYFNILLIGAMYLTALLWLISDPAFVENLSAYYGGILTAGAMPEIPLIGYWHIGITLFFIFYLPFTHMTHFFTKYFTYHSIRWEDTPNIDENSKMRKKIAAQLNHKVTWSAPHIGADGKKTWLDLAQELPFKEDKDA